MLKESLFSTHVIGEAGAIGKTLVLILIDLGVESACCHFFHDGFVFALVCGCSSVCIAISLWKGRGALLLTRLRIISNSFS